MGGPTDGEGPQLMGRGPQRMGRGPQRMGRGAPQRASPPGPQTPSYATVCTVVLLKICIILAH